MDALLRIGLLGLGTVGSAVARALRARQEEIRRRTGRQLVVTHAAVRDLQRSRNLPLEGVRLHDDPLAVVEQPDVDLVVELMGGERPALDAIERALRMGRPVVTANKVVVARHGAHLLELAAARRVPFLFEAAVGGAIPIIRPIQQSLASDRILAVMGIVNGTCNFVLTSMAEEHSTMEEAVRQAQARGYAEADPTADLSGSDAAHKLAVLASLAFNGWLVPDRIACQGITGVEVRDIQYARELGFAIKLLAAARQVGDGDAVEAWVGPALVPLEHPLAQVRGVNNAIVVVTQAAGELMFYGPGAGGDPTAAAVLGDVMDIARRWGPEGRVGGEDGFGRAWVGRPQVATAAGRSRYYVRLQVVDRPGVLAAIASVFGRHMVSIESVLQKGRGEDPVDLVFITHETDDASVARVLQEVAGLSVVVRTRSPMRVMGP
ncbi:MAG TPA: homoserine dehydrogenase [Limnochordales bacterium]